MHIWNMQNLCLQTCKTNRIRYKFAYLLRKIEPLRLNYPRNLMIRKMVWLKWYGQFIVLVSFLAVKFPMVLLIKQMGEPAVLNLFPKSIISFTKFDGIRFTRCNSDLMVFLISLLGMLDVHGIRNLVFYLFIRVCNIS